MVKTSKKILAVLLSVMFILAMVPFAVSAATEEVSFTVDCAKPGYTFTVYQVATLDTETGKYTMTAADANVRTAVMSNAGTASVLQALDNASASDLGTVVDTYTSSDASSPKTFTVTSGLYYIKATTMPSTVKSVTNSVVALPYYQDGAWNKTMQTIDLAQKVNDGDVVVEKEIVDGDAPKYTTAGVGDEVIFNLTSSVVGSTDMKLQEYTVVDTMGTGLTFKQIDSVKLTKSGADDRLLSASEYQKVDGYTYNGTTYTFGVQLADDLIASDDFYSYDNVVVTYTAVLNNTAVIGSEGNPNSDGLVYENANDVVTKVDGNEVKVYTFGIQVEKVDSNDNTKKLEGAVFGAYDNGTLVAKAVTGANGIGEFMEIDASGNPISGTSYRFDKGSYTVKELTAPAGYNLNSKEFRVSITPAFNNGTLVTPANGYVSMTVENTPVKLPETGGMGTMVFTITGAALIACAGVLFVVLKKKKNASK